MDKKETVYNTSNDIKDEDKPLETEEEQPLLILRGSFGSPNAHKGGFIHLPGFDSPFKEFDDGFKE